MQTGTLTFDVASWAAWRDEGWHFPARAAGSDDPEKALPAQLRRRVTPLGRKALAAAWTQEPPTDARFVFCSRHGEYARTDSVLESLARDGTVSPAEFSLSVHHALAGLLSIATGSREGHTAIAAGRDSFGFGLVEAAACLAEPPARPVVLVAYDEPLPPAYAGVADRDEAPAALAVTLRAGRRFTLAAAADGESLPPSPSLAADFAAFLESDAGEGQARGDRMTWRWRRVG